MSPGYTETGEVLVLVILICLDLKVLHLCATLNSQLLAVGLLLRCQCSQSQIAEFQLRLDPEKCLASLDEIGP